jgi:hypothetical protein
VSYSCSRSDQSDPRRIAQEVAWFSDNANDKSHQVKQRVPNPLGLYDIQGNVAEWCEDHYSPYPTVAAVDPLGVDGELRVVRGGSWGDPLIALRAANRIPARQDIRSAYLGLRIAVDLDASSTATSLSIFSPESPALPARVTPAPQHPETAVAPLTIPKLMTAPAITPTSAVTQSVTHAATSPAAGIAVPATPAGPTTKAPQRVVNGHGFPRQRPTTSIRGLPAVSALPPHSAPPATTTVSAPLPVPPASTPQNSHTTVPKPAVPSPVAPHPVPTQSGRVVEKPASASVPLGKAATSRPHIRQRPTGAGNLNWRTRGCVNAGY